MKHIFETSEVLGTVEVPAGLSEVCVAADASYDESAGRLIVRMESFLRPTDLLSKERHFRATWLPRDDTASESVAREESLQVARDIFRRWVRKVRDAAPQLHPL
jgi:hypothetical protein